jgi:hypothetical protein
VLAAHKVSKDHNILTERAALTIAEPLACGAASKVAKPPRNDSGSTIW